MTKFTDKTLRLSRRTILSSAAAAAASAFPAPFVLAQGAKLRVGLMLPFSGTYAALGIVAALNERARTGLGQAIDVSMLDCLFSMMMDEPIDSYEKLGLETRQGNRIMRFSPFNAYRARDGWVTLGAVTHHDWLAVLKVIGRENLITHEDFSRVDWRIVHNEEVDRVVGDWLSQRTVSQSIEQLRAADVPCGTVRTPHEAIASPQLRARDMVQPLRRPNGQVTGVAAAGMPLKFSRSVAHHDQPAPVPGAHTAEVLERFLGIDARQAAELRAAGII